MRSDGAGGKKICLACMKVVTEADIDRDLESGGMGFCMCEWKCDDRVYNHYYDLDLALLDYLELKKSACIEEIDRKIAEIKKLLREEGNSIKEKNPANSSKYQREYMYERYHTDAEFRKRVIQHSKDYVRRIYAEGGECLRKYREYHRERARAWREAREREESTTHP